MGNLLVKYKISKQVCKIIFWVVNNPFYLGRYLKAYNSSQISTQI